MAQGQELRPMVAGLDALTEPMKKMVFPLAAAEARELSQLGQKKTVCFVVSRVNR